MVAFSLVELSVVLVLLTLGLVLAAPDLSNAFANRQLEAVVGRFQSALNLARSESIKRNHVVTLCPSRMSVDRQPRCGGGYAQGWLVFANAGRGLVQDVEEGAVLGVFAGVPGAITVTNRNGNQSAQDIIHFAPDGSAGAPRTLLFCRYAARQINNLSLVINGVGRTSLVRNWGRCPAAEGV
ncbi:MAG: GspH/FimT family protein [Pseudomonadota bacterium]